MDEKLKVVLKNLLYCFIFGVSIKILKIDTNSISSLFSLIIAMIFADRIGSQLSNIEDDEIKKGGE